MSSGLCMGEANSQDTTVIERADVRNGMREEGGKLPLSRSPNPSSAARCLVRIARYTVGSIPAMFAQRMSMRCEPGAAGDWTREGCWLPRGPCDPARKYAIDCPRGRCCQGRSEGVRYQKKSVGLQRKAHGHERRGCGGGLLIQRGAGTWGGGRRGSSRSERQ